MKCPICGKDKSTEYELAKHIFHKNTFRDKQHWSWTVKNKLKILDLDGIYAFLKER